MLDFHIDVPNIDATNPTDIKRQETNATAYIRQQRNVKLAEMTAEHEKRMEQLKEEHENQMTKMNGINEEIKAATAAKDFKRVQELFKDLMAQMKA
jgi:mevalonate kinase